MLHLVGLLMVATLGVLWVEDLGVLVWVGNENFAKSQDSLALISKNKI